MAVATVLHPMQTQPLMSTLYTYTPRAPDTSLYTRMLHAQRIPGVTSSRHQRRTSFRVPRSGSDDKLPEVTDQDRVKSLQLSSVFVKRVTKGILKHGSKSVHARQASKSVSFGGAHVQYFTS